LGTGLATLKRGLLAFWAIWFTLAALTNLADASRAFGIGPRWRVTSGNYRLIQTVRQRAGVPRGIGDVLFAGAILWEALAGGLFWRAFACYRARTLGSTERVNQAFIGGLSLWAGFMVADELLAAHDTGAEAAHMRTFTAQLATLMSLHLLPD